MSEAKRDALRKKTASKIIFFLLSGLIIVALAVTVFRGKQGDMTKKKSNTEGRIADSSDTANNAGILSNKNTESEKKETDTLSVAQHAASNNQPDNTIPPDDYKSNPTDVLDRLVSKVKSEVNDLQTPIAVYRTEHDKDSYQFTIKVILALRKEGYVNVFENGFMNEMISGNASQNNAGPKRYIEYKWEYSINQYDIIIPSLK